MNIRYKVLYNVKSNDGFLTEKTDFFATLKEAFIFVRRLKQSRDTLGSPMIERS